MTLDAMPVAFRVYDANAMKPTLHLLGDKYKAAKYIRFAERKLAELKHFMKMLDLDIQNRSYRFTAGDTVYVESFRGIDKIRIKAAKEEVDECIIDFNGDVLSGSAPLFVTFTPDDVAYYHAWDYGDGAEGYTNSTNPSGRPVSHNYHVPGTYTVTGLFSLAGVLWENVPFTNLRSWTKGNNTNHTTELAAWNDYNGLSFVADAFPFQTVFHFLRNINPTSWRYRSKKFMVDIDLTAYDGSKPIVIFIAFNTNDVLGVVEKPGTGSGGWKSSLGGSVDRLLKQGETISTGSIQDIARYRLIDLTAYAGTILTDVEFTDNTDFARKTGPFTFGNNTYYGFLSNVSGNFIIVEIQTPECTKIKTDYITVT